MAKKAAPALVDPIETAADDRTACGIMMPISDTANHPESHWSDVRTLLHRAVDEAGFRPINVWENTATDRVSERIIANLFDVPLAIADISDLNPNVMLELGLRLSSKRPTVVIVNKGGTIPFDIRDFHAVDYPADMNMLGMEDFFERLSQALREKYDAFQDNSYLPFLGNVMVDVISPEKREVGLGEVILSRLDDMASKIRQIERDSPKPQSTRTLPSIGTNDGTTFYSLPDEKYDEFCSRINSFWEVDGIKKRRVVDGFAIAAIDYSSVGDLKSFRAKLNVIAQDLGGRRGIYRPVGS